MSPKNRRLFPAVPVLRISMSALPLVSAPVRVRMFEPLTPLNVPVVNAPVLGVVAPMAVEFRPVEVNSP